MLIAREIGGGAGVEKGPPYPYLFICRSIVWLPRAASVWCLRVVAVLIPMGLVNQSAGVLPVPAGRRGAPPSVTAPDGAIARCAGSNAPATAVDDPWGGLGFQVVGGVFQSFNFVETGFGALVADVETAEFLPHPAPAETRHIFGVETPFDRLVQVD